MTNLTTAKAFIDQYRRYVRETLEPTQQDVIQVLSEWQQPNYWAGYAPSPRLAIPSPVQLVLSRVKAVESTLDKILRKPQQFPKGLHAESFETMNDALGARVIVYFLSHLSLVHREIVRSSAFEVSRDDPPTAYLTEELSTRLAIGDVVRVYKESGYASIHYVLRLRDSSLPEGRRPWFELQLRTLCEDTWSEIEHVLGYKFGRRTSPTVRKQFRIISKVLGAMDEHFDLLYEELSRSQDEAEFREADALTPENLPPVLSEVGLLCAQQEIADLLKLLESRGVETVRELTRLASQERIDLIRSVYEAEAGRPPSNFEVVANLVNAAGAETGPEMADRIRTQMELLQVWSEMKRARRG